ncbi:hypothetical protein CLV51_10625 [Chitinophaga niastensis]|uniref:KTSC domain-containing protein n=1 Tax=Chitinophaga niastensis TaxID=536980 RepID=A0A2P8HD52_CHINA|nr:hypothetical protein CLV51_10625 [Chitinophaga niastensis]
MEIYQNIGGDSGVYAFLIDDNSITVEFSTRAVYLYNYSRPGSRHVDQMKTLALSGRGLNSYISRYVGKNYASRLR